MHQRHRHIFQDVYPWAGEFRTVNISRSGQFPFAFSEHIISSLDKLSVDLEKERYLGNIGLPKFCTRAAHYLSELNAIHPFRDGNGRMQREVIRQLALRSGYSLDWSRVSRGQMTEASKNSFQRGDNAGLEKVLQKALDNENNRAKEKRDASASRRCEREDDRER
jgi:cell filamentation protein